MRAVVTGAAGFIGSHLCDRLLADRHVVVGIDRFSDYYPRELKERNLVLARAHPSFAFHEVDLVEAPLAPILEGADVVFHLAGQPGVRPSWGSEFDQYVRDNITGTRRLLESLKESEIRRLVYASSSSVYGNAEAFPTKESALPQPLSPYGLTKLAGEQLALLYMRNFGTPVVALRYFTVYGPRQRPDMAFSRFMRALTAEQPIEILGDGEQTREFTYVSDAVDGTVKAALADAAGLVINLGGGSRVTINRALDMLADISQTDIARNHLPRAAGDPRHTSASINLARRHLGWEPRVSLAHGLLAQWDWYMRQVIAEDVAGERIAV
jgi:nucleoside-diphosphate-sugar epimerase